MMAEKLGRVYKPVFLLVTSITFWAFADRPPKVVGLLDVKMVAASRSHQGAGLGQDRGLIPACPHTGRHRRRAQNHRVSYGTVSGTACGGSNAAVDE